MQTIKLLKRGNREILINPDGIIAGHVLDKKKKPTGRLIPERVYELKREIGEELLEKYPKDFMNLSLAVENTVAPEVKTSAPQGAVPVVAPSKGVETDTSAHKADDDSAKKAQEAEEAAKAQAVADSLKNKTSDEAQTNTDAPAGPVTGNQG